MSVKEKHFVVVFDYTVDDEHGVDIIGVRHTIEEAKELFEKQKVIESKNAENNGYDYTEVDETAWSSYIEGEYSKDHIDLYIQEVEE